MQWVVGSSSGVMMESAPFLIHANDGHARTAQHPPVHTSPNSFSITAIRFPCWAVRIWFSNVWG